MSRPPELHLLFVHGWGFGRGFWRMLQNALPGHATQALDLGFFGAPVMNYPEHGNLVLVGHSMGFLWWLQQLEQNVALMERCRALVCINGFPCFCQQTDFAAGIPQRMVERMANRLGTNASEVLQSFGMRGGLPLLPTISELNVAALSEGLAFLSHWDGRAVLDKAQKPLLVLAGQQDLIVPPAMTMAAFGERVVWNQEGNHVLPLSHPEWCAARIQDFLHAL